MSKTDFLLSALSGNPRFSGFFAPIHPNFEGIELARPVVKNELVN